MPVIIPGDYRPLLLPETIELAFATVRHTGESCLESAHLRHVAPPVLVKATGHKGEVSVSCRGVADMLALPADLEAWKRSRMSAYGIGAGYGLYTYTIIINTDIEPDNVNGPVSDRWHCIRSIEPEQMTLETLSDVVREIYALLKKIEDAVHTQFPHIPVTLPSYASIRYDFVNDAAAFAHDVREHRAFALIDEKEMTADLYVWSDVVGCELHIASVCVSGNAVSGWICPARIAIQVLRLSALQELFPLP